MTTYENWIKDSLENYIKHYTGIEVNVADDDVQHFAASVKYYVGLFGQPSLPSNLDEAAEEYQTGYKDGKAEALKDLPRWKKTNAPYEGRCPRVDYILKRIVFREEDGDNYYLEFSDLYKLPKEEQK